MLPLFWKSLLKENARIKELRGVDMCTVQILEILKNSQRHRLDKNNFTIAFYETLVTKDLSGREFELVE